MGVYERKSDLETEKRKEDKTGKGGLKLLDQAIDQVKKGKYTGLIILACLGVGLIVIGNLASIDGKNRAYYTDDVEPVQQSTVVQPLKDDDISQTQAYKEDLEKRLRTILSRVKGAGTVYVEVNLSGGVVNKYAVNSDVQERKTDEYDTNGVKRSSLETQRKEDALMVSSSSSKAESPVIIGEEIPEVAGVLVVATGAFDSKVKMELANAVEALLGVASHRVVVLAAEG